MKPIDFERRSPGGYEYDEWVMDIVFGKWSCAPTLGKTHDAAGLREFMAEGVLGHMKVGEI